MEELFHSAFKKILLRINFYEDVAEKLYSQLRQSKSDDNILDKEILDGRFTNKTLPIKQFKEDLHQISLHDTR